jgi:hypothetical protein
VRGEVEADDEVGLVTPGRLSMRGNLAFRHRRIMPWLASRPAAHVPEDALRRSSALRTNVAQLRRTAPVSFGSTARSAVGTIMDTSSGAGVGDSNLSWATFWLGALPRAADLGLRGS